jgi:CRP-like cAMP-binding protein
MLRHKDQYLEHLAQVPMFRACSQRDLVVIGRQGEDVTFHAGRVVVKEGDPADQFYVIVSGKAEVTRRGKSVATLGPGDYFGELGLLAKVPRDATVTAKTDLECVSISRREFGALLEDVPTLTRKLLHGMALRLHELDQRC